MKSLFSISIFNLVFNIIIFNLVWSKEELLEALLPIFEKVQSTEPESNPFMEPVNPDMLGIPVSSIFQLICTKLTCQIILQSAIDARNLISFFFYLKQ